MSAPHLARHEPRRLATIRVALLAVSALLSAAVATPALAQESMNTAAATMPSKGTLVYKPRFHYAQFGRDPSGDTQTTRMLEVSSEFSYGLARAWAMSLTIPAAFRDQDRDDAVGGAGGGSESDQGIEDLDLMLKWRIYKSDSVGVNTVRVALLGGASFASGDDHDFSSQTINPMLGVVATVVRGRHGFNQELSFRCNNTDDNDNNFGGEGGYNTLFYNTSYVYRLWPEQFTSESKGGWYATAELNGIYESNGDHELRFTPGVMYEAWRWTFELMAVLPVWHNLEERPELDWGLGIGFRFSF